MIAAVIVKTIRIAMTVIVMKEKGTEEAADTMIDATVMVEIDTEVVDTEVVEIDT